MEAVLPLIEWCRQRIAQGQTHLVISELERMQIPSVRNHIALISNRWKELQQHRISNTISLTDYELGRNKITSDLLELLDLVEKGDIPPSSSETSRNSRRILVPAFLVILVLVIGWFFLLKIGLGSESYHDNTHVGNHLIAEGSSKVNSEEPVDKTYKAKTLELPNNRVHKIPEPNSKGNNGLDENEMKENRPQFKDYLDAVKHAYSLTSKEEALSILHYAVELTDSEQQKGDAYYCIAQYYYKKLQDKKEAIKWLQKAYESDPIPKYKKKIDSLIGVNHVE